jgi:hypothetical protein
MIRWEDIELHMQDARDMGYTVQGVLLEDGPHCGLIIRGAGDYWAAVRRSFDKTLKSNL